MFKITFDDDGYQKYTYFSEWTDTFGKVIPGGRDDKALFSSRGPYDFTGLQKPPFFLSVRVDLGAEYTLNALSADRRYDWNESTSGAAELSASLYDENNNFISTQVLFTESEPLETNHEWITESEPFSPIPHVRYIHYLFYGGDTDIYENTNYVYLDNLTIDYEGLTGRPAPNITGLVDCVVNNASGGAETTMLPISLRTGEKYEAVTDLSLNTPAGALEFTRAYRQSMQEDANYQFMGLGWKHNHHVTLTENTGVTPNTLTLRTPNGGETRFTKTAPNYYQGDPGSTAFIVWDSGFSQYTLTAADKSIHVFDDAGKLLSRTWPNGETWTYVYDSGRLAAVVDQDYDLDPGMSTTYRKLQFSYIDHATYYDDGLLWRVGDHTASGLDGGSPSGRYVEFGYTPEKNDGVTVSTPKALLANVRDVRGNTWTYDYYGQHSGETDADQLNLLTKVISPSVDITGDGTPDSAITLKDLSYTFDDDQISEIVQQNGIQGVSDPLLETTLVFQAGGDNVTTETVAGVTTTHHFGDGVYTGSEDANGNTSERGLDAQYRPTVQRDANGNTTLLTWSSDGKQLLSVEDALSKTTQFAYNSDDTLHQSIDAEGRHTLYAYEDTDNPRQPTLVVVTDGGNLAVNGGMETDSDWTDISGDEPDVNQRVPRADTGLYSRHVVASAADQGIEGAAWDLEDAVEYVITARVYPISGTVKMQVTGTAAFDQNSLGIGAWETLSATYTPSGTTTGKKLQFIAVNNPAEFYVDSVSIRRADEEIAVNGGMETDSDWTDISGDEPDINEQAIGADTGSYARRIIASADGEGIEGSAWDLIEDRTYLILARVYPVSGTVKMQVTGTAAFDANSVSSGAWETLKAVYQPTSGDTGLHLQFVADGGAAEFYLDSVFILDSTMLFRWQAFGYDAKGRTLTEEVINPLDGSTAQQVTRTYYSSAVGNGLLETVTQEDIGGMDDVVTTYSYDSVGRVVKTHQSSNFGSCEFSYTVYDDCRECSRDDLQLRSG